MVIHALIGDLVELSRGGAPKSTNHPGLVHSHKRPVQILQDFQSRGSAGGACEHTFLQYAVPCVSWHTILLYVLHRTSGIQRYPETWTATV